MEDQNSGESEDSSSYFKSCSSIPTDKPHLGTGPVTDRVGRSKTLSTGGAPAQPFPSKQVFYEHINQIICRKLNTTQKLNEAQIQAILVKYAQFQKQQKQQSEEILNISIKAFNQCGVNIFSDQLLNFEFDQLFYNQILNGGFEAQTTKGSPNHMIQNQTITNSATLLKDKKIPSQIKSIKKQKDSILEVIMFLQSQFGQVSDELNQACRSMISQLTNDASSGAKLRNFPFYLTASAIFQICQKKISHAGVSSSSIVQHLQHQHPRITEANLNRCIRYFRIYMLNRRSQMQISSAERIRSIGQSLQLSQKIVSQAITTISLITANKQLMGLVQSLQSPSLLPAYALLYSWLLHESEGAEYTVNKLQLLANALQVQADLLLNCYSRIWPYRYDICYDKKDNEEEKEEETQEQKTLRKKISMLPQQPA